MRAKATWTQARYLNHAIDDLAFFKTISLLVV